MQVRRKSTAGQMYISMNSERSKKHFQIDAINTSPKPVDTGLNTIFEWTGPFLLVRSHTTCAVLKET